MTHYETACEILKNNLSGVKYSYKMLQTPEQVQQSKRGDCFQLCDGMKGMRRRMPVQNKDVFNCMKIIDKTAFVA